MSQFVEQVEILMYAQQTKYVENIFGKLDNYNWLTNKRPSSLVWISSKDEFKIRRCLMKLNEEQKIKVMKQLVRWLEEHPSASALKIPETCLALLTKMDTSDIIRNVTISRMTSFRNSLRKFSSMRINKIAPERLKAPPVDPNETRRSVTFNDELQIYRISS